MVYRIYSEKKPGLDNEARGLLSEATSLLGIKALTSVRILNRYDVENIAPELFERSKRTVFSEPQLDNIYDTLPETDGIVFAVEYLPGQFDQRADSAAQCIQLMSQADRPTVRSAKVPLPPKIVTAMGTRTPNVPQEVPVEKAITPASTKKIAGKRN